jgi:hypothetical protein
MTISMHDLAIESFAPMLRALSEILDKGAAHAAAKNFDGSVLVGARLAPDMFSLAEQVQQACAHAKDSTARLIEQKPPDIESDDATIDALQARIEKTIAYLERVPAAAFAGAESKSIEIPLPNGAAIVMSGAQYLRDWALPQFYFHLVTAYDILRHNGVDIGKRDYLSRVAAYIREPAARAPRAKKVRRARRQR